MWIIHNISSMNTSRYSYEIDTVWEKSVFKLISSTGACVGKIIHMQETWKMGNIYRIPLLWTANGWDDLDNVWLGWKKWIDGIWLDGIEKASEKIPWLLYIMFTLFIKYIRSIDRDTFSISVENPLLTLESKYRQLHRELAKSWEIGSGFVNANTVVFRCD